MLWILLFTVLASSSSHAQTPAYRYAAQFGDSLSDAGLAMATDANGNIHVGGTFRGTVDFDPGVGVANITASNTGDIYVAKYDASGNYVWAFHLTGSVECRGIAVDAGGNVIVTGQFVGSADFDPGIGTATLTKTGTAPWDMFVAKYSPTGNHLWSFKVANSIGESIRIDASGDAVISGFLKGSADFDPGSGSVVLTTNKRVTTTDCFVAKYSSTGTYRWAFRFGGDGNEGAMVALDPSGNVYVSGSFERTAGFNPANTRTTLTSAGQHDIFVAKYSSAGAYQWAFRVGGIGNDLNSAIAVDASANIYVAGGFSAAIDFDPGAGNATRTPAAGGAMYIAKYSTSGAHVWSLAVDGASAKAIALDGNGDPHVSGTFVGTVDFDPSTATNVLTSVNASAGVIAKYSATGVHAWALPIDGATYFDGRNIAVDPNGNINVAGSFRGSYDFDPSSGTAMLTTPTASSDSFIASYAETMLPKRYEGPCIAPSVVIDLR